MMNPILERLRLPVAVAPMFLVSGPEMVIAAARAGLVGAFPTPNCRTTEQLDQWMTQIVAETKDCAGIWAANLVTHSTNDRLADDLALVAKHKPPIVITALGSPAPAISVVHEYGWSRYPPVQGGIRGNYHPLPLYPRSGNFSTALSASVAGYPTVLVSPGRSQPVPIWSIWEHAFSPQTRAWRSMTIKIWWSIATPPT